MNTQDQVGLTGKKIVVLGGTAGIGLATAIAAAEKGAHLVLVSSNEKNVEKALKLLPGSKHAGFTIDLTNEGKIKELFQSVGKFDHLVYTAGESLQLEMIADTSSAAAHKFFELRYWGAYHSVKYSALHINKGGSIVLTGGTAGRRPGAGWSLGASICAAMEAFTRTMALELAPIRVNIVVPGIVQTNVWANFSEQDREGMYQHYNKMLPVKHVGSPEEVAQSYIYLMEQTYSTGQSIVVDGGGVLV